MKEERKLQLRRLNCVKKYLKMVESAFTLGDARTLQKLRTALL